MKQIPITPYLYSLLLDEFPQVFQEQHLIPLLHHLLLPSTVDDDTKLPLISTYVLANLEDKLTQLKGHRYNGKRYLDEFELAVGKRVRYSEYIYSRGKARSAALTISDTLAEALEDEMCVPSDTKLIDMVTGTPIRKLDFKAERKRLRELRADCPQSSTSPATDYARWLNRMDVRIFGPLVENMNEAIQAARKLENAEKRRANLGTLFRMRYLEWVPTYKTTNNTPRIYTNGSSPASLSGSVRKALLGSGKATFHADLVAAQLAILAHIWNLPIAAAAVANRGQVWETLLSSVGLESTDKGKLKTFIYSTAFGMREHALRWKAIEAFGPKRAKQLLATSFVQELLEGRRRRQQQMIDEDGFTDPFNVFRSLSEAAAKSGPNGRAIGQVEAVKMLMAYEAQAYELRLMEPVLKLAMQYQEFRILFWLHDGVYLNITQPERADYYKNALTTAVAQLAQELGIKTELDIDRI